MEQSLDIPIWDLPACFHHDLTPTSEHATMPGVQATTAIVSKMLETMGIWPIEVDCHAQAKLHTANKLLIPHFKVLGGWADHHPGVCKTTFARVQSCLAEGDGITTSTW
jgi:hypothetical protein